MKDERFTRWADTTFYIEPSARAGRRGRVEHRGYVLDRLTGAKIYSDRTWNRASWALAWGDKVIAEYRAIFG